MKLKESLIAIGLSTLGLLSTPEKSISQTVQQIKNLRSGLIESVMVEDSPQIDLKSFEFITLEKNINSSLHGINVPIKAIDDNDLGRWIQDSNCGSYIKKDSNGELKQTFIVPQQQNKNTNSYNEFKGSTVLPQREEQENLQKKFKELGLGIENVEGLYCEGGDIMPFTDNQNNTIIAYGRNTMLHNVSDYFLRKLPELDDEKIQLSDEDINKWGNELGFLATNKNSKFIPSNYRKLRIDEKLVFIKKFARAEKLFIKKFRIALHIKENYKLVEMSSDSFHIDTHLRFLPIEDKKFKGLVLLSDPKMDAKELQKIDTSQQIQPEAIKYFEYSNNDIKNKRYLYEQEIFNINKSKLIELGFKVVSIPTEKNGFIPANGILVQNKNSKKYIITSFAGDIKDKKNWEDFGNFRFDEKFQKLNQKQLNSYYYLNYKYLREVLEKYNIELVIIESGISIQSGSLNCLTVPIIKNVSE
jgi:N-dimethylarginine dimethylaminohydrolase